MNYRKQLEALEQRLHPDAAPRLIVTWPNQIEQETGLTIDAWEAQQRAADPTFRLFRLTWGDDLPDDDDLTTS